MKSYIESELLKFRLIQSLSKIREGSLEAISALKMCTDGTLSDKTEIVQNLYKSLEREIGVQCQSLESPVRLGSGDLRYE